MGGGTYGASLLPSCTTNILLTAASASSTTNSVVVTFSLPLPVVFFFSIDMISFATLVLNKLEEM